MDIIIEIVKPYSQNLSKVNHKFNIVWIEWFGQFQCKQMQNICEIAWVNNKTLGNENWLPQHAQNIIAVKNFCSKMKNFNILTQKWNKLMKITLSAQFYEKGFKSNTPTQCNSRSLSHPPSPTLVDNESNRKSFWNRRASKKNC